MAVAFRIEWRAGNKTDSNNSMQSNVELKRLLSSLHDVDEDCCLGRRLNLAELLEGETFHIQLSFILILLQNRARSDLLFNRSQREHDNYSSGKHRFLLD